MKIIKLTIFCALLIGGNLTAQNQAENPSNIIESPKFKIVPNSQVNFESISSDPVADNLKYQNDLNEKVIRDFEISNNVTFMSIEKYNSLSDERKILVRDRTDIIITESPILYIERQN